MRVPIAQVTHHLERWARRVPESAPATQFARMVSGDSLRILGFHGVEDLDHFERLMRVLVARYQPVSADQVRDAVRGAEGLPKHAMWVTFDDGLQSTFDAGALLQDLGISATAFVCPASIGASERLWFQTVTLAEHIGLRDNDSRHHSRTDLKRMPDPRRRAYVADLENALLAGGHTPQTPTVDDLHHWIRQGHTIGNHTWDHPCLDTCSTTEQERQIVTAHQRLQAWGIETTLFAYPNGNYTKHAETVLQQLGYQVGVLFDHRLAHATQHNLRLSRLRIDSTATPRRARSIVSGAHPAGYRLVQHMRKARRE